MDGKHQKKTAQQPAPKKKTTFLSLPGELRNRIYRMNLVVNRPIVIDKEMAGGFGAIVWSRLSVKKPSLLAVSKQVHKEASSIFFEDNRWVIANGVLSTQGFYAFTDFFGYRALQKLKSIGIQREYHIRMGPSFKVYFTAEVREKRPGKEYISIRRNYLETQFPGWKTNINEPHTEPCRCEVVAIAKSACKQSRRADLIDFVSKYIEVLETPATWKEIEVCKRCESVRRH